MTSALVWGEWSASWPARFTPREIAPGSHWIEGWVGPRTGLDVEKRKLLTLPGLEFRPPRPYSQSLYRLHYPGYRKTNGLWTASHILSRDALVTLHRHLFGIPLCSRIEFHWPWRLIGSLVHVKPMNWTPHSENSEPTVLPLVSPPFVIIQYNNVIFPFKSILHVGLLFYNTSTEFTY
jgi:hypothetical protein